MLLCIASFGKPWATIRCPQVPGAAGSSSIVLGRAGDVQLEDPSMPRLLSRKHCRLVFQSDGNLEVEDLGSINGTFVQRPGSEPQRLSAHVPQPLQPEDTLLLGGQEQVNDYVNNRPVPNPFVFLVCPAGAAQQDAVGLGGFNTASSSEQHQQVQEESCHYQHPRLPAAAHQQQDMGAAAVNQQQQQQQCQGPADRAADRVLQDSNVANIQQQHEQQRQQQQLSGAVKSSGQIQHGAGLHICMQHRGIRLQPAADRQQGSSMPAPGHQDAKQNLQHQPQQHPRQQLQKEVRSQQQQQQQQQQQAVAPDRRQGQPTARDLAAAAAIARAAAAAQPVPEEGVILDPAVFQDEGAVYDKALEGVEVGPGSFEAEPAVYGEAVVGVEVDPACLDAPWRQQRHAAQPGIAVHLLGSPAGPAVEGEVFDETFEGEERDDAVEGVLLGPADLAPLLPAGPTARQPAAATCAPAAAAAAAALAAPQPAAPAAAAAAAAQPPAAAAGQLPPAVTPPSTASKRRKPHSSTVSSSSKKVRKISTSCVTCVICKELLVATHTLGCGHMFCGPCLAQWLEVQQQPSCPTCRAAVTGAPVRTYGFDSVVAEAVLAAGSEPQDMAARLEAWNAVKDVTTASWQELFIGAGSRNRKAKQQPSAAAAAAAAAAGAGTDGRGRGGASTARGGSRGREVGQRTRMQAGAAADAVQLHRGDVHLLAGLRQPAAAAAAGAGVGDAPGGANLHVTGQAARTAGATAAASRQQRGGGRRRGRGRTQQQQQQQRQAAAHGVAGQAAGLGVSRVPGQQLQGFRQQGLVSSAAVQGGSSTRHLRQMGIGDYIR